MYSSHGHGHSHSHGHGHSHGDTNSHGGHSNTIDNLSNIVSDKLKVYLADMSKIQQAYAGAFFISSSSFPIFILLTIFRIDNLNIILNIFTAFSAGALLGEVFVHSIPEMTDDPTIAISKEILICIGIVVFFFMDKLLGLINQASQGKQETQVTDEANHAHGHNHANKNQNILICLFGDTLHNVADGLAIGAAFSKNIHLGIGLTVGIFFHEIPHEVGDFSYLLKQKLSIYKVFLSQIISALGAFAGVYLSTIFGEMYSTHILAFSCGSFLYLSINSIMSELKIHSETDSIFMQFASLVLEVVAIISGVLFMTFFV